MASSSMRTIIVLAPLVLIAASLPGVLGEVTGYAAHSEYGGFGEPISSYTVNTNELMFHDISESLQLSISTEDFAVYRYGYASYDGKDWQPFELSGKMLGGEWLNGSVSADVQVDASDFGLSQDRLLAQRNFVVVYTCSRVSGSWDCHGGWQIWQLNASLAEDKPPVVYAVNSGGEAYTASDGVSYSADSYFSGGNALDRGDVEVSGTTDDYLYSTERWGDFSYDFPVQNGDYEVTLKFMEGTPAVNEAGERVFDVEIEGNVVISDLDIYETVGKNASYDRTFDVSVSDGELGITFTGRAMSPVIEAIVIRGEQEAPVCTSHATSACYGGDVWWYDSCGQREGIKTDCSSSQTCSDAACIDNTPTGNAIDVIGPHEFWTHQNAQDGDYIGYVKFFDMDEDLDPSFSIVSGNNGAFSIEKTKEISSDMFPEGLIKVADSGMLTPGATYTLDVRIYDSATGKDSTAPVVIHVATAAETVYVQRDAPSGGDGSYAHPLNSAGLAAISYAAFESGNVYLFRRGDTFGQSMFISNPDSSRDNPTVFGAYGQGPRPVFDGNGADTTGIQIGSYSQLDKVTGYVYLQNLEVTDWGYHAISNGAVGHHDLTFLDVYAHHNEGVWWMWASAGGTIGGGIGHGSVDLNITIVDSESSYDGLKNSSDDCCAGTKWYPAGMEVYNFRAQHNQGNGMRMLMSAGKFCKGCVFNDNAHSGAQVRSSDTTLEYFKAYNNGWNGIELWFENSTLPGTRTNFTIRNGELYDNYPGGITIWGMVQDVLVENVTAYENNGRGVGILGLYEGTRRITIKDSVIRDNTGPGVYMSDKDSKKTYGLDYEISDNDITGNTAEGILADYVKGLFIAGNTFSGNAGNDISVDDSSTQDVVVSGNSFL